MEKFFLFQTLLILIMLVRFVEKARIWWWGGTDVNPLGMQPVGKLQGVKKTYVAQLFWLIVLRPSLNFEALIF